jgi:hypothetical protein
VRFEGMIPVSLFSKQHFFFFIYRRRGDLTRAREYYKKSSNIKLDYPEYLLEAWLTFEHHFGGLDDLEYAISKVNNLMKGISARRKRVSSDRLTPISKICLDECLL